jgi:hypothetical protein
MQRFLAYANGGLTPFDVAYRLFPEGRESLGAAEKVAGYGIHGCEIPQPSNRSFV